MKFKEDRPTISFIEALKQTADRMSGRAYKQGYDPNHSEHVPDLIKAAILLAVCGLGYLIYMWFTK